MRLLHFGCGPNRLEGWENYDRDVDLTAGLPFPDRCARRILAEHVVEHLPFPSGLKFLAECHRLLSDDGRLRLSFPDPCRVLRSPHLDRYGAEVSRLFGDLPPYHNRAALVAVMARWGHLSAWTECLASAALVAVGFPLDKVRRCRVRESDCPTLAHVVDYHLTEQPLLGHVETVAIETAKGP